MLDILDNLQVSDDIPPTQWETPFVCEGIVALKDKFEDPVNLETRISTDTLRYLIFKELCIRLLSSVKYGNFTEAEIIFKHYLLSEKFKFNLCVLCPYQILTAAIISKIFGKMCIHDMILTSSIVPINERTLNDYLLESLYIYGYRKKLNADEILPSIFKDKVDKQFILGKWLTHFYLNFNLLPPKWVFDINNISLDDLVTIMKHSAIASDLFNQCKPIPATFETISTMLIYSHTEAHEFREIKQVFGIDENGKSNGFKILQKIMSEAVPKDFNPINEIMQQFKDTNLSLEMALVRLFRIDKLSDLEQLLDVDYSRKDNRGLDIISYFIMFQNKTDIKKSGILSKINKVNVELYSNLC